MYKSVHEPYRDNVLDHIHMRQWMDLGVARLFYFAARHIQQLHNSHAHVYSCKLHTTLQLYMMQTTATTS